MLMKILYAILIILLFVLFYVSYDFYQIFFSTPKNFAVNYTELENKSSYSGNLQFYPDMLFNHKQISYSITDCPKEKISDMISAFDYLENRTGVINFYLSQNSEINVSCGKVEKQGGLFIAGEGGPTNVIDTKKFKIISSGEILLLYSRSECGDKVALHELLHVFGFEHSNNPESVMYNVSSCSQVLTSDIVDEIKRLYSIPELPDLYFNNIQGNKKGSYLSMNFSARNSGLIGANSVSVILYSGKEAVRSFNLGSIEAGGGMLLYVENLKVPGNPLKLIISDGEELDKKNNGADLNLG